MKTLKTRRTLMILPTSSPKEPRKTSSRTQVALSHLGLAEVGRPDVNALFSNAPSDWLTREGGLSPIGFKSRGGGSLELTVTGPRLKLPEFSLGQRGKPQDGGSRGVRHRQPEFWVYGGGGQHEQRH